MIGGCNECMNECRNEWPREGLALRDWRNAMQLQLVADGGAGNRIQIRLVVTLARERGRVESKHTCFAPRTVDLCELTMASDEGRACA